MNDGARADVLVALLDAERDKRRQELIGPARDEARGLAASARRNATARVKAAVSEERALHAARVKAEDAKLATARRMRRERHLKAVLAQARAALPGAVARRWGDATCRAEWIDTALDRAASILEAGLPWGIEVPATLDSAECGRLASRLAARGIAANLITDPALEHGLRVSAGKVRVDASVAGLLDDSIGIEGRLVRLLEAPPP